MTTGTGHGIAAFTLGDAALVAATLATFCGAYGLVGLLPATSAGADRMRGPWPPWLRATRPLARRFGPALDRRLPLRYARHVAGRLRAAELDRALSPGDWSAARLAYALVGGLVAALVAHLAGAGAVPAFVLGGVAGGVLPESVLRDRVARRAAAVRRELPAWLDLLTLGVESGSSLTGAIALAAEKAPDGPLARAFGRFLSEVRAGRSRVDALQGLDAYVGLPAVSTLVAALVQAEQTGSRLGPTLRAQSAQRSQERFARAEKLAMQAPVRLLGPLILCIFPCTFIVLGFPIVTKLAAGF